MISRYNYPEFKLIEPKKKYAIMLTTGCGVMEDPSRDVGFICESDNYDSIRGLRERMQLAFNGFYDQHKSWQDHNFSVYRLNEEGKYVRQ